DTGAQVVCLGKTQRWDVVSFGVRLTRHLRRLRPDVLYAFMPTSNVLATLVSPLLPGTKIVFGVRGSPRDWGQYGKFVRAIGAVERRLARRADLVIANSA